MKKTLLFGLLLTLASGIHAQFWLDQIQQANPNLQSIRQQFDAYWANRPEEKGQGIKPFKRWEWFWTSRVGNHQSLPKPSIAWEEWMKYQSSPAARTARTTSANWVFGGPSSSSSGYYGIGRLNVIAFHPTNTNIFYVGAPAGGLWKTTNGGTTWTALTDNLPVIGVSGIVLDPTNANTIYIMTGDADGADTYSIGVLKSTDGGLTWNTTGLSPTVQSGRLLKRIQINPNNPQMLWVAANDGIWRTTNGGANWSVVQTGSFVDLELNPANPNIIYAVSYATNSIIYRSDDAGANFTSVQTITGGRRVNLAVTPANPSIIHALACNSSGGLHSMWKSTDAGLSYIQYLTGSSTNNMLNSSATGTGSTSGQGTYDLAFNIDPTDENKIWLGGINTWASLDGGTTWFIKTIWSGGVTGGSGIPVVHADKHFQAFQPGTNHLFECNDGGLYKTMDGGFNWIDLSNGLGISQMYRIGVSASTTNQVLAGLQDNSTKEYKNNTWFERRATGDGFESIIDPGNASVLYVSSYYGNVMRSLNGGTSWSTIAASGGTGVNSQGPWLTPYVMNPQQNNTLLLAKKEVYRSYDQGTTWTALTFFSGVDATAIAYAPSDTNTIYAAFGTALYRTTDGGATWANTFVASSPISYIAVHPQNPQKLWLTHPTYSTINPRVQVSSNGGASFTGLNGTLPNLPVNCIVYQIGSNDGVYIGTDVGVYYRDNTMSDWAPFQTGLPNVIVNELEITYNNNRIWAATYGRGLWSSTLQTAAPCTPPAAPTGGSTQTVCQGTNANLTATVPSGQTVDWYTAATGGSPIAAGTNVYTTSTAGTYYAGARLIADGCASTARTAFTLNTTPAPAAPSITFSGSSSLCAGGSLTLNSSIAAGNQWYLNGAAISGATAQSYTATQSGNYTVTTTGGGCSSANSSTVSITVNPLPAQPTISVNGAQFTSSSATGNQWYLNGSAISGANGQVYNATANGNYTVVVTINGCSSPASAVYNHVGTAVTAPSFDVQITMAPNPVRHLLEITYTGPAASFDVDLLDMKGRTLFKGGRLNNRYSLNMHAYAAGSYIVRITNRRTGESLQRMIVKQ
jgi:photosystem II stability/assembly factor-like uncharacterized protein